MYKNIDRNGKEEANKKQAFSRMTALMLAMLMLVGLCACGDAGTTTTAGTATTTKAPYNNTRAPINRDSKYANEHGIYHVHYCGGGPMSIYIISKSRDASFRSAYDELYKYMHNTLTADEIKLDPIENEQKWADGAVDWT